MDRRQFIRTSVSASASLAVLPGLMAGEGRSESTGLPRRVLGKTGAAVTILGLGCAYLARDKSARNRQGSEAHSRTLIEAALEGGIRYFDTAPNYFQSEERLGAALAPVRDQVFLVTKLDHGDAKTAEQDLAQSLKRLKTDHVDLLLLHGLSLPGFDDFAALKGAAGALSFLQQARRQGLTRFIGCSSHPEKVGAQRQFIAGAGLEVVQPFVNYVAQAEYPTNQVLLEAARKQNLGLVAMKVLGGDGQLADDYDRAFRYALSVPGVHCALIGAASVEEVRRAVQAARRFRPLSEAEMQETVALGRKHFQSGSRKSALLRRHLRRDVAGAYDSGGRVAVSA